jgi:hypothetical protein
MIGGKRSSSGGSHCCVCWNAAVGPLVAIIVRLLGEISFGGLLWSNGISFGGVSSFIYADLLMIPLILIYGNISAVARRLISF